MRADAEAIYQRISSAIGMSDGLSKLSDWLVRHTSLGAGLPWSYKDHEFQRAIADDMSRMLTVKKCSQVGLSELSVRKTLAYLANANGVHAIYTLPTSKFASHFAKTRFDPVIEGSKVLRDMVNSDVDSTEVKQVGPNFLYIKGTMGQSSAISVPASMIVQDEVDFCDQSVLTTYASRLRHAEGGGYMWRFSTPTVGGYGISGAYDISDQHVYLCKCHCGYEDAPDFYRDMKIPGHEVDMEKFSKEMLHDHSIPWKNAVMVCPKCGKPWPLEDPERRRWVALRPDVTDHRGYWVRPWDAPKYNTPYGILSQALLYDTHRDWANFVLGEEHEDTENSVVVEAIDAATVGTWVSPDVGASSCVFGCDVGKVSNIVIARKSSRAGDWLDVLYAERIQAEGDGTNISDRVVELAKAFGCIRGVIDAAPDFTTALRVVETLPAGIAFANYYTKIDNKRMSLFSVKDDRILHSNRTKTLNSMVAAVNMGQVTFPIHEETKFIKEHLRSLKRVTRKVGEEGDLKEFWVNSGPDHYAHALNYAMIAARTVDEGVSVGAVGALPSFGTVKIGSVQEDRPKMRELTSEKKRRELFNKGVL